MKKKQTDSDPLQDRVVSLELQLEKTNELLRQLLLSQQQQQGALEEDIYEEVGQDRTWDEEQYFVRIKPYNEKRGHLRRRTLVPELGRPINGGTGKIGDIPEWMPVDRARAITLTRYHQDGNNPDSPLVFDICTKRERELIDHREGQQRMAGLGMAGIPPAEVIRRQPQMQAKIRPLPSTVPSAERYGSQAPVIGNTKARTAPPAPPLQAGRRKALEGVPAVPPLPPAVADMPPPPPAPPARTPRMAKKGYNPEAVAEDMSYQAMGHGELDADIDAAAQIATEPMGRMTPA